MAEVNPNFVETMLVTALITSVLVIMAVLKLCVIDPSEKKYNELRADAVRRGYAEWTVTDDKSDPVWRWKDLPEKTVPPGK